MDEALVGFFVTLGCGLLCIGLGAYMVVTGNPALLHSYHYATTPLSDRPALARESGAGLIAIGIGCSLMGLSDALGAWITVMGAVLLVAGIAFTLISIVKHNGALISFIPASTSAGRGSGLRFGLSAGRGAVLGILLGLISIVPGAYMIVTGDVSVLHSYHYEGIAATRIPHLALVEGVGMVGLGIGIFLCCLAGCRLTIRPVPAWSKATMAAGGIIWCASLVIMLLAIPYFGGSLVG